MLNRRAFITSSVAIVAGACWRSPELHAQAGPQNRLKIPPLSDAARMRNSIGLSAQEGETDLGSGQLSPSMGFNGDHLGPTLRLRRGDEIEIDFQNDMREGTAVHWHGLLIPAQADGEPYRIIAPKTKWRPRLRTDQPGATCWYHAHPHGATARQVHAGLAGMLIIGDDREADLGLPSDYGVDDVPLILQDLSFARGRSVYDVDPMTAMMGFRGDVVAVNGTIRAVHKAPAGLVRLRLVNASNARVYELAFSDDRVFQWIATDGGLLPTPVGRRSLTLAPGQRAEIVVDLSNGKAVTLGTDADPSLGRGGMGMGRGMGMGMGMMMARADPAPRGMQILRLEPQGAPSAATEVPQRLAQVVRGDPSRAARRREIVLNMGHGMMGGGMMGGRGMGPGPRRGISRDMFAINGRSYDSERIDARVRLGDTEIWEVSSDMMIHPFHIHGVQFEVLNGAPQDRGMRDTVLVGPRPVELLITFTQPADQAPFVFHCHTLEHEDAGMMGQYLAS